MDNVMELPFDLRVLIVPAILLVLVMIVKTVVGQKKPKGAVSYPYVAAGSLFTKNEQAFLRVLEQAARDTRIFGKVRVADVIEVRQGLSKSERHRAFNRVSQKHLDFVLCNPHDLSVRCVVELDDKTHGRADRKSRDEFLDKALAAANVPLIRVSSKRGYEVSELRALLEAHVVPKIGV